MTKIIRNGIEYGGNTDYKVSQTATSDNANYEVLFSGTADNITRTEGVVKTNTLIYNPSNYNFASKCQSTDASKTDNGISSSVWYPMMSVYDKSNRVITRIESAFYTNGDVRSSFLTRQYDTNGDQVANKGISMTMDKSGNLTYTIADPANFRAAIGLSTTNVKSQITITKSSGNWSVNSYSAYRTGNTITLYIKFRGNGSSVNAGANAFQGTVSGITPIVLSTGCGYIGGSAIMGSLSTTGNIIIHIIGSNVTLGSTSDAEFSMIFITDN